MAEAPSPEVCRRIARVRMELTGARGKSAFAKQLGIAASTYDYYESMRVPPADILVRIADLADVDLRWLLTGESGSPAVVAADHPVLQRAAAMLAKSPDAASVLAAFLDLLAESRKFPSKAPPAGQEAPVAAATASVRGTVEADAQADWIPILGRSAAGVPHFWADEDQRRGVTELAALARAATGRQVRPARISETDVAEDRTVQIITLTEPDRQGLAEFVAAAAVRQRYADAFAVRLDGESMSPEFRHGDLVIVSPSAPAADGRAAVVQLARQIGVTCKLYRREGDVVHLVPINEQFAPQSFPADQLVWALRVLARVRAT